MLFHVVNRGVGRMDIFEEEQDYIAFEGILEKTVEVRPMRVCSSCLMPNHWHFALWRKQDGDLAAFLQRLTVGRFRVHGGGWSGSKKLSSHDGYGLAGADDSIAVYADAHNAAAG